MPDFLRVLGDVDDGFQNLLRNNYPASQSLAETMNLCRDGPIECREQPAGLLTFYRRKAA